MNDKKYYPLTYVVTDGNCLKLTKTGISQQNFDSPLYKEAKKSKRRLRQQETVKKADEVEIVVLLPKPINGNNDSAAQTDQLKYAKDQIVNTVMTGTVGFAIKEDSSGNIDEIFVKKDDYINIQMLSESTNLKSKTVDLALNLLFKNNLIVLLHSKRVGKICRDIAKELKFSKADTDQIRIAGLLHDIGKLGVSDAVLNKLGKLDQNEWKEIERHSEIGFRILCSVTGFTNISDFIMEHHERWDGKGYPRGISGKEISLQARIISVADAFDAMTSDRPYRKAMSIEDAILEIEQNIGSQFDPEVAKAFIDMMEKKANINRRASLLLEG